MFEVFDPENSIHQEFKPWNNQTKQETKTKRGERMKEKNMNKKNGMEKKYNAVIISNSAVKNGTEMFLTKKEEEEEDVDDDDQKKNRSIV